MRPRIAVSFSRIRLEDKMILEEFAARGLEVDRIDDGDVIWSLQDRQPRWDLLLDRSLGFGRARATAQILESRGVLCVNSARTVAICGDKLAAQVAIEAAGVPTPATRVAFSREAALAAAEELGYPVVIKPTVGSWGRLVARLNDRDAAEAVLEDRELLGNWTHHVYYLQKLVDKPGRDIRLFVIGGRAVAAVYRVSEHWITNTARGGRTENCPVDDRLAEFGRLCASACGAEILAVDLVEDREGALYVLELNHSMEFRNSVAPTGVNIPGLVVDHLLQLATERGS
ncbi:MAG: lysine biosynthesis protein LysX [Planctomycetes bacterium]|nr:lysine biosynthesis protein LysX [Planctomycetota bacterium]